mgnify:CR=1 FL=1
MNNYRYYELPVRYLGSGLQLRLPVHEFTGDEGPTVGITACIHGDECVATEIARRTVEFLKGEENIHGTIKIMPVASPLGFEVGQRNTPVDKTNMNRIFPGNPDGMITDVTAHVIATQFLQNLDTYIDIHSGGQDPVVDYAYVLNDEELSRASLANILYRPVVDYEGTSVTCTKSDKTAAVTLECGGNCEPYAKKGLKAVVNMLRHKKAIDGEAEKRDDQIMISHIEHVNPHHGGLFVPALTYDAMNTIVEGRVVLGRVYNPMTLELLEEIRAPYDRNYIILMRGNINRIYGGDFSFMIGDLSSEIKE